MRITPRKEESTRVISILESSEFTSAEAMAKAVIKECAEILAMRDWTLLGHRWGDGPSIAWGPFGSESEAASVAKKLALPGQWGVQKIYSSGVLLGRLDGKQGWAGFCQTCGHTPEDHLFEASSRGACGWSTCQCKKFAK